MDITQLLLEMAQSNAQHIEVLNREMGHVMADVATIKWFIAINVVAWVGLIVGIFGKRIMRNGKNNKK